MRFITSRMVSPYQLISRKASLMSAPSDGSIVNSSRTTRSIGASLFRDEKISGLLTPWKLS